MISGEGGALPSFGPEATYTFYHRLKDIYLFTCIFILLSRESDQSATRARLGVASYLSTTPRWENPAKCQSQRHK